MGTEIERKFLVVGDDWRAGASGISYVQGYLSRDIARIVRVRQAGPSAYLTIKGMVEGASRPEFEYSIPLSDAQQLMNLCLRPLVEKTR
jgi:adenylate cyclase